MKKLTSKMLSLLMILTMLVLQAHIPVHADAAGVQTDTVIVSKHVTFRSDGNRNATTISAIFATDATHTGGTGTTELIVSNASTKMTTVSALRFPLEAYHGKVIVSARLQLTGNVSYGNANIEPRASRLDVYAFPDTWRGAVVNEDVTGYVADSGAEPDAGSTLVPFTDRPVIGTCAVPESSAAVYVPYTMDVTDYIRTCVQQAQATTSLAVRHNYDTGSGGTKYFSFYNIKKGETESGSTLRPHLIIQYADNPLNSIVSSVGANAKVGQPVTLTVNTAADFSGEVALYEVIDGEKVSLATLTNGSYTYTIEAMTAGSHTYSAVATVSGVPCEKTLTLQATSSLSTIQIPVAVERGFSRAAMSGPDGQKLKYATDYIGTDSVYGVKGNSSTGAQHTHAFLYFNNLDTHLNTERYTIKAANLVFTYKNRILGTNVTASASPLRAYGWDDRWAGDNFATLTADPFDTTRVLINDAACTVPTDATDGATLSISVTAYVQAKLEAESNALSFATQYDKPKDTGGNETINLYTIHADADKKPYLELVVEEVPQFQLNLTNQQTVSTVSTLSGTVSYKGVIESLTLLVDGEPGTNTVSYSEDTSAFSVSLNGISEGAHTVQLALTCNDGIDTYYSPLVSILVTNQTYSIQPKPITNAEGVYTTSFSFENLGTETLDIVVLIGAYDANHGLKATNLQKYTIGAGEKKDVSAQLNLTAMTTAAGDYVRGFIWDNLSNCRPYTGAVSTNE